MEMGGSYPSNDPGLVKSKIWGLLFDGCCPAPLDLDDEVGFDGVANEDDVSGFKYELPEPSVMLRSAIGKKSTQNLKK